jgi:hypothetical protein
MIRSLIRPSFALLSLSGALMAQESWDAGFKLIGASATGGASSESLGRSTHFAFAIEGSYPIFGRRDWLVFDAGWRAMPARKLTLDANTTREFQTEGVYGSAMYRREFGTTNLYAQAGIRYGSYFTSDTVFTKSGTLTTSVAQKSRASSAGWVIGAGVRFNNLWSLDISGASLSLPTAQGGKQNGAVLEVALGIHL